MLLCASGNTSNRSERCYPERGRLWTWCLAICLAVGLLCLFYQWVSPTQRKCLKKTKNHFVSTWQDDLLFKPYCSAWFAMCQKSEQPMRNRNPRRVIEISKGFQVGKEFSWILGSVNKKVKKKWEDLIFLEQSSSLHVMLYPSLSLFAFLSFPCWNLICLKAVEGRGSLTRGTTGPWLQLGQSFRPTNGGKVLAVPLAGALCQHSWLVWNSTFLFLLKKQAQSFSKPEFWYF